MELEAAVQRHNADGEGLKCISGLFYHSDYSDQNWFYL